MTRCLSDPKFLPEINKTSNPGISWHHLAWQILWDINLQVSRCFRDTLICRPQMSVSVKWLAYLKCKLNESGSIWFVLMPSSGSEMSSVWESRSRAHPRGIQDSHQLRGDQFGPLRGKVAQTQNFKHFFLGRLASSKHFFSEVLRPQWTVSF